MMRRARSLILAAGLALAAVPFIGAAENGNGAIQRLALVIAANDGGPGRPRLRYAVSDARAMIHVLENLGGVSADDSRLLLEPSRETLLWETGRLRQRSERLRREERRLEVLIYYSGHSDEDGLLLGREKFSYRELRAVLQELAADVRIAILDSCASGAFLRAKGGRPRPPFLFDAANDMKGFAVMTSSSADEASQESERIRGSFFTRALITGLRGAADATHDGRVTLSEAYQYAFNETLRQTEKTSGGPQHPSYNIQMAGTGDVVLTDVRRGEALLRLGRQVAGRVFVHDPSGALVMEFHKPAGSAMEMGLDAGRYRLIVVTDGEIRETETVLVSGDDRELDADRFRRAEIIDAIARGDREIRSQGWPPARKTLHFYAHFFGKLSRYEGRWTFMPGMQLGGRLGRSLAFGLVGFGRVGPETDSRPPFWGLAVDYAAVEKGRLGLRLRTVAGFMYKGKEDELARRLSLVVEPGFGLAWALSHRLNLTTQVSLDFVNGTNDQLRRFSWGLGLELCRQ